MKKITDTTTPPQRFFVGQLVRATEDHPFYWEKGDHALITFAACWEVCVKGGLNPEYAMEWAYVGVGFSKQASIRGTRLDRLSSVEIVQGI